MSNFTEFRIGEIVKYGSIYGKIISINFINRCFHIECFHNRFETIYNVYPERIKKINKKPKYL